MLDTKLIQVLRCLDAKKVKKLYEFIESSFFTKRKKGVQLLNSLKPYFPTFEGIHFTKEDFYLKIFEEKEFNNLDFNRILGFSMEIVEDFLRYYYFQPTDLHLNKPLLDFYLNNNLDKHFDALYKSLESASEKLPHQNDYYLSQKWLLADALYAYGYTKNQRENAKDFHKTVERLDNFYIAKKLNAMCINISNKYLLNNENKLFIEDDIISHLKKQGILNFPIIIQIYYHLYLIQKADDYEYHFEIVKNLISKHGNIISNNDKVLIYTNLQNFCIQQINKKGDTLYEQKLFELYNEQLSTMAIGSDIAIDNIPPGKFKNIVQLSLRLKEYDWAAHFIETYSPKLSPDKRSDVENQARASYAFAIGKYSDTLKILQDTEPVDIFFKIDAKRLIIRTYYELQEEELALSSLNTFRVFVHRDNIISENHKLTNRNFTNILAKLIQTDKTDKLIKLQEELKEMPSIADRKWLAEKIAERIAALK